MKRATRVIIDKITKSIEERISGKSLETNIVLVTADEIKTVYKKDGWLFNWKAEYKEVGHSIYKLTLQDNPVIQGLVSLQHVPDQKYIEMPLIESAPHNLGSKKEYVGVAGNLVAFACKESFDAGYGGFVGFRAKTQLIQHYMDSLGAELLFRDRMSISGNSAKKIVNSYYKNYFDVK